MINIDKIIENHLGDTKDSRVKDAMLDLANQLLELVSEKAMILHNNRIDYLMESLTDIQKELKERPFK